MTDAAALASGAARDAADADGDLDALLRPPQQERSRRTLERMLAAALELLEAEGPDALTVTGITRRAKMSVGSFYARFDGKDDLLRYLGEASLEEARASAEDLLARVPDGVLRARISPAVLGLMDLYLEGPARPLLLLDGVHDPAPSRRSRLEDEVAGEMAGRLPGPRPRTELGARVLLAALREAALRRGDGDASPFPPGDGLARELTELLVGYLGGEVRRPEPPRAPEPPAEERAPAPSSERAEADEAPRRKEPPRPPRPEIDPFDVWE